MNTGICRLEYPNVGYYADNGTEFKNWKWTINILNRIINYNCINRNATKLCYWYFKLIKYLPCCNVRLISLKFISHNKLEWFQTSLNFMWFKCMMMVKPYTVCVDRMCLIKGASYEFWCQMDMYTRYLTQCHLMKKETRHGLIFLPVRAYLPKENTHVWIIFSTRVHNCA